MVWDKRNKVIIRAYSLFGRRDHYAHFLLDFLIPVWAWLWQNGLERREDFEVYFWDGAVERFRPIIDRFFYCKVKHISELRDKEGIHKVIVPGFESHARRDAGLELRYYIGPVEQFMVDLHEYVEEKLGVSPEGQNVLLHVCREKVSDDRGGGRRSTSNEDELSESLKELAARKGLMYRKVQLAGMRFAMQVEAFMEAKAVVAQHGAALANLFWMRKGSVLLEYHWNDEEAYRKRQTCGFLGRPMHVHARGKKVGEGRPDSIASSGVVEAPIEKIVGELEGRI